MYYAVKINGKEVTDFRNGDDEKWEAERVFHDNHVRIRNTFEYWEEVNDFHTGVYGDECTVEQAIESVENDLMVFFYDALRYRDEDELFMGGISFVFDDKSKYEHIEDTREPLRDYENMGCWGE